MSLPVIPIAAGLGLLALLLSKGGKGGSSQSSEGGEDLPDGTLPGGEGSGGQGGTPELSGGLVQLTPILENFQLCLGREMSRQSAEGTAHERFQIPEDVEVVPLLEGVITEGADFQGTASDTLHLQYNYPILPGGAASLSLMDGGKARLKKASDADGSACPPYPSARILAEESPYSLIFATISEGGTVFSTVAQTASAIELEDPLIRAVAVVPARNHGVVMAERAQLPLKVEMKPFVAIAPGVNVGYQQGFIDSVPFTGRLRMLVSVSLTAGLFCRTLRLPVSLLRRLLHSLAKPLVTNAAQAFLQAGFHARHHLGDMRHHLGHLGDVRHHLGDVRLRVIHAPGHAPDQCVIYHEESGTLWAADMLTDTEVPFVMHSLDAFATTLAFLATLDIRVLVPGHGTPATGAREIRTRIAEDRAYLAELRACVIAALADGKSMAETVVACAGIPYPRPCDVPNAHEWNIEGAYVEFGGETEGVVGWDNEWGE